MVLEKMAEFFEKRIDGYDEHMLNDIEGAKEFYSYTAKYLPVTPGSRLLDLGCGTGIELEFYFALCPDADVTGIDLSMGMLDKLRKKFEDKSITLIHGSYFDVPLGSSLYDAAVSVESLHHFTKDEKLSLYKELHKSLRNDAYFILTDYFAASDEEEKELRNNFLTLKSNCGITDNEFYHYDTPLTVEHEYEVLYKAGFSKVETLNKFGATYILKAYK